MRKYPKNLWVLAIGMMINNTGNSFLWPLNTIYISVVLQRSVTEAGFVLMLNSAANLLGNLCGGTLYDRIGGKKAISLGIFISIVALLMLAWNHDWYFYITMMIILGFGNGVVFPAIYAMANGVWPEGGRKAFTAIYVSQNVGVAIGSALGGIVSMFSFTFVFLINAATYLVFLGIIWWGLDEKIASQPRRTKKNTLTEGVQVTERSQRWEVYALSFLSLGFMVIWFGYIQLQSVVPVYMENLGIIRAQYSLLWAINGLMIIFLQPVLAWVVDRYLSALRGQLLVGSTLFVIALAHFSQQDSYPGFVIGMVVITLGEMLVYPAVPTAAAYLAPAGKNGLYQGIASGASTAGKMLGPVLGGFLFDQYGYTAMMWVMVVIESSALLFFFLYDQVGKMRAKQLRL